MMIPIGGYIPVDDIMVSSIPKWLRCIWKFYERIERESITFIKNIKDTKGTEEPIDIIYAFFKIVCLQFCYQFFNDDEARMHFRILRKIKYESFASWIGTNEQDTPKEFGANEGVFKHLGRERRCIVKSKNPNLFAPGRNPNWEDYLSGPIDKYLKDDYPILTFGVSIKFSNLHSQILYFLSFIRFEELLSSVVENFDRRLKLVFGDSFSFIEVLENGKN